ncbi:uncharacterized protein LOC133823863 [Humulus lupulus]|uniref:uncharacterized protein LOC133823863 n=1 Tax=Humulus lupulus TaxID=3486 RepID=UPI002B4053A6|nr:uncharacterized protein LOC133823863 [Humulus lupulus]
MGTNLNDYNIELNDDEKLMKDINEELAIVVSKKDLFVVSMLNKEQKYAYDIILKKVFSNQVGAFFIDGPGGAGKKYLYSAILATVRSKKLIALASASSEVAATILPGGRTTHSRFKIPLEIDQNCICGGSKQSSLSNLSQLTTLIIWDEAPMIDRQSMEVLNIMLQDINESNLIFGGKVSIWWRFLTSFTN